MKKIKTRIGILFILLTVFTMFASCLNDDDEPKDKQKTVTLYVSATTGERTGMTGTPHECMLIKEKGERLGSHASSTELKALHTRKDTSTNFWLRRPYMPIHQQMDQAMTILL